MNSFNQISYNNGVLTINGTTYNIQANGNSITGTSFSKLELENNILKIDGVEITLTEYGSGNRLLDVNGNVLLDANGNTLLYGGI